MFFQMEEHWKISQVGRGMGNVILYGEKMGFDLDLTHIWEIVLIPKDPVFLIPPPKRWITLNLLYRVKV